MSTVIKVENLSKQYRLGTIGTGSLAHDVQRWWAGLRGKEDPFLKIGEENKRDEKGTNDYVWSLKDIDFEVHSGEALGIIGKNGAGKSTLLKILSKVTAPTTGKVKIKGRVASLLEVGTGFHPELTGRENIFLNGAILGMGKQEITNKFDEIVAFSGVEKYIDTPVKRYSSGMYVRLAFAVAAHLEPEILIIDEVLAVGDAEFQKKCLGKMKDVSAQGRTVIFVSHNMDAIRNLCTRAILIQNGKINSIGHPEDIVQKYIIENYNSLTQNYKKEFNIGDEYVRLLKSEVIILNQEQIIYVNEPITIKIIFEILNKEFSPRCVVNLLSSDNVLVTSSISDIEVNEIGIYEAYFHLPNNFLNNTIYNIHIEITTFSLPAKRHLRVENVFTLDVLDSKESFIRKYYNDKWSGLLRYNYKWQVKKL